MRRHWKKILIFLLILLLVYIVGGVVLSSIRHRYVGEEFTQSFSPEKCYGTEEGAERVRCIEENDEALLWRLRVIESAQEELILSTFDLREDNSGKDVMSALYKAAERGVHIRILLDGMNGMLNLSGSSIFQTLAAHPNIAVKYYNPVKLWKPWKLTYRLHDKYLMADDKVYILGGRNTFDLFLGDYAAKPNIDRDLLVYQKAGGKEELTSVKQVKDYFEAIWELPSNQEKTGTRKKEKQEKIKEELAAHYEQVRIKYPSAFEQTDYEKATIPTNRITLLANPKEPVNREPALWYMLYRLMEDKDKVIILSPYIICSEDMYRDLTAVCNSTKETAIITNAVENGANPWGCTDYLNQSEKIHQTGATIYEYMGQNSLHTKTILIDERLSIVGSYNLDMRSTYLDTEMMLVVDSTELNEQLSASAQRDIEKSRYKLSDGTYAYGSSYVPIEMSIVKKAVYTILRIVILPFRYML